jgi:AraC-like DNA-binding protein
MEAVFDDHILVWFISGETKIIQTESCHFFRAGDIFLIPRHQLATVINYSKGDLPHKTVVMHLTVDRLRSFYSELGIPPSPTPTTDKIVLFKGHPLLRSCMASLIPYFDLEEVFPEDVATIKLTEALTVLRTIDGGIDEILSNFDEPRKVDLVKFMEDHFVFNLSLEKFGYLTGRSLSSFNRDFRNKFGMSPQKWLVLKRLELAHRLILEGTKRPVDVYLEVGFEDLSHFSFAFKKQFGYPPTALAKGEKAVQK